MVSIALRNLLSERTKLSISVGGVAFSVMLILIILSLYQGWKVKSTEYIRSINSDLWVTQFGSADISTTASVIPLSYEAKIQAISGVEKIYRFIGKPTNFQVKGKDVNSYIIGFDPTEKVAGPQKIIAGRGDPGTDEIVIDTVMAQSKHLSVGDNLEIFGRSFKIIGISQGSNMFLFQFAFINRAQAVKLLQIPDFTNFFLVKTEKGQAEYVKDQIDKIQGIEAFTKSEFVDKNRRQIDEIFLPIISVLIAISVLVGTAVIGLTIYTATVEKSREFGVLKALGASNMQIYRVIFEQSLVSGLIGYIIGVVFTKIIVTAIPHFVAVFITYIRYQDLAWVFVLAMTMSFLASYIPVQRIVRIDPAEVFKS